MCQREVEHFHIWIWLLPIIGRLLWLLSW